MVLEEPRPALTDSLIRRSVGHEVFRRGAAYASEGRVSDMACSRTLDQFEATAANGVRRPWATTASALGDLKTPRLRQDVIA